MRIIIVENIKMGVSHFDINVQRSCLHRPAYDILSATIFDNFLASFCACSSGGGTAERQHWMY